MLTMLWSTSADAAEAVDTTGWRLPWDRAENPWTMTQGPHGASGSGLDFDKDRTPRNILSMFNGKVVSLANVACPKEWGKISSQAIRVRSDAQPAVEVWYVHVSDTFVSVGQAVPQGKILGKTGDSGCATAVHLHIELILGGRHPSWAGLRLDTFIVPTAGAGSRPVDSTNFVGAGATFRKLEIAGGTWNDRLAGVIGTAFDFRPVSPTQSVEISGPSTWNANQTFNCVPISSGPSDRVHAPCWVSTQPASGSYRAKSTVGGVTRSTSVSINPRQILTPPTMSLEVTSTHAIVRFSATSGAKSFAVRANAVPYLGVILEEIVVPTGIEVVAFPLDRLPTTGIIQFSVFAFSADMFSATRDDTRAFNISSDSRTLIWQ
jgi:hypothetical protein